MSNKETPNGEAMGPRLQVRSPSDFGVSLFDIPRFKACRPAGVEPFVAVRRCAHLFHRVLVKIAAVIWASPYTLAGLAIGLLGLSTGGRVRMRDGVLEFSGGATRWFVSHLPTGPMTLAITLGHVVLGQTEAALDISHDHEMVHVRQYSRWGPLMGPAYLLCALVLWTQGRHPYRDNPFERQAYDETESNE